MKITYDPEGDILELTLRDTRPVDSKDVAPGVTALLDEAGGLVALEILDASKRIDGDPAQVSLQVLTEVAAGA